MPQLAVQDRTQKPYLQSLKPIHRAMARSLLAGATPADLQVRYGYSLSRISIIMAADLFKHEMERLEKEAEALVVDAHADLVSLKGRAIEIIAEELYSDMASARRTKSAFDVLDRTGSHPRGEAPKTDNRKAVIINYAPMPGEDPKAAEERLDSLRKVAEKSLRDEELDEELLPELGE